MEERPAKARRAAATPRRRSRVGLRAASHSRAVLDFQERLAELDRRLDEAIGAPAPEGPGESFPRLEAFARFLETSGVARLLDRVDRVRASERADEYGLDPGFEDLVAPFFTFLYRRWFRVDVEDIENVPSSGAALVVANHAGTLFPWDGAMLKVALRLDHPARRELRPLVENFVFSLPFVGSLMTRVGGVRACPENGQRLLADGEVVAVFPEGLRGIGKPFRDRYRLQRFGRGGFVTLALATGAPIVPAAIIGAEEIHPMLGSLERPARLLGLPYLPLTPTFPWLGLLGLVPLPSKWTIRFGEPMAIGHEPRRAGDRLLVDRITAEVRSRIQEMVDAQIQRRRSVFF